MPVSLLGEKQYLMELEIDRKGIPDRKAYPFCLPMVSKLRKLPFHPQVTFFVGENGTGKSTLLEAIAVASGFNPEGGSRNFSFSTRSSHSNLYHHLKLRRGLRRPRDGYFLRAESFYNVATNIEELDKNEPGAVPLPPVAGSYGGRSLHEQSHGESFWSLIKERFGGQGLYILDEPEAALSPTRQMALLARMHELVSQGSQFIIATHSPIIMAYPEAIIYSLSESGAKRLAYTETEHFQISRAFLNDHERMLKRLLGEG